MIDVGRDGPNLRYVLLLIVVAVIGACRTPGWTLTVENNTSEPRLVRVQDGPTAIDRRVGAHSTEWVVIADSPPSGPVSLVDPSGCEIVGVTEVVPRYHAVMVIDAGDRILIGESGPGELPDRSVLPPVTAECGQS